MFKNAKSTGSSVLVGGDNKGLINTGVIENSEINIDAKSFERYEFEGKTDFFESLKFKLPLLWTLRNCINQLQVNSQHDYCEVRHKAVGNTSTTWVSISKSTGVQSLEILLFQKGDSSIGLSAISGVLASLIAKHDQFSDIRIIINSSFDDSLASFISNACIGKFSRKLFRRSKEKLTGFPICDLEQIFEKLTVENLKGHYTINFKGTSVTSDIAKSLNRPPIII